MSISTGSGVQFFIGTTDDAENLSQFLTDTYIEVGEVEDLGEFGDESELVTFASLANARLQKLKGVRDAGTLALVVGADDTDVGQDALIVAEADDTLDFSFKVILNDKATLGGAPSEHYFRGKVMSKRLGVGTVNNVIRRTFNIGVNSEILSIDAT
jgi:hypothetical protein